MELEERIRIYQPADAATELIRQTNIVLLVGISGAGKDTIKRHLLARPDYHHIVSHTTRPPRVNSGIMEVNGVNYHFIDIATAEQMLKSKGYIEAKFYSGNVYGTSVAEIQMAHDEGKVAITDMEIQGVAEYVGFNTPTVKPVFILPPDFVTWQQRLLKRYGDSVDDHSEDLAKRIATSKVELREALEKDYYYLVVNKEAEKTSETVDHIAHSLESPSQYRTPENVQIIRDILAELEKTPY